MIKKVNTIVYLISFLFLGCNSSKETKCDSIQVESFTHYGFGIGELLPEDEGYLLKIYDEPNGNVISNLPPAEEAGHIVNIIDKKNDLFKIEFSYVEETNLKSKYGWVKKGTLGIVTRNYDNQKLNLYDKPNLDSSISSVLEKEQIVRVLDACNKWVYVETINEGKIKRGWLQPDMQCGNPYTTCP